MCNNCIKIFITITAILSICFSFTISSFSDFNVKIFLYDGTTKTQLADNDYDSIYHDTRAQINNTGVVVWSGYDGNDSEIFLYDGTTTTRLTDNSNSRGADHPQINNSGEVVWCGGYGTNSEIFFYNLATTTRLTDNNKSDMFPQINDSGEVVWYSTKPDADGGGGGGGGGGG